MKLSMMITCMFRFDKNFLFLGVIGDAPVFSSLSLLHVCSFKIYVNLSAWLAFTFAFKLDQNLCKA
jgi:hypothetical protein